MVIEIDGVIVNEEGTRRLLHEILEELRHIRRELRRIEGDIEPPKAQSAKLVIKEN